MKPAQIPTKQYLWDQLDKHIVTDPLDGILKQIENLTHIKNSHPQQSINQYLHRKHYGSHTARKYIKHYQKQCQSKWENEQ